MQIIDTHLKFKSLTKRKSTDGGVVFHHSACHGSVEDIHRLHLANGWSGIGYHIYIRMDGKVYKGRPIDMIGAHASGVNYNTIGVCCEGNFENEQMPEAQKQALKEVVSWLRKEYGITRFRKHRDVSATACPGKYFPYEEVVNSEADCSTTVPLTTNKPVQATQGKDSVVRAGQIHANNFAGANLGVDGVRGAKTIKGGIMVLQTALNLDYKSKLVVDGEFGPATKSVLGKHYVKKGEKQYMVTALQILLMLKGYACDLACPGTFDSNLETTVKRYQRDYQLTIDGVVGYNTWMSLIH